MSNEQIEPYTGAWYRQQFAGVNHRLNQQASEYADQYNRSVELQKRVDALEAGRAADKAMIGELIAKVDELKERLDKARDYILKKNGAAA